MTPNSLVETYGCFVKPAVHIIEVGGNGVDIAMRRTRAELWLGALECEGFASVGEEKNWTLPSALYLLKSL